MAWRAGPPKPRTNKRGEPQGPPQSRAEKESCLIPRSDNSGAAAAEVGEKPAAAAAPPPALAQGRRDQAAASTSGVR